MLISKNDPLIISKSDLLKKVLLCFNNFRNSEIAEESWKDYKEGTDLINEETEKRLADGRIKAGSKQSIMFKYGTRENHLGETFASQLGLGAGQLYAGSDLFGKEIFDVLSPYKDHKDFRDTVSEVLKNEIGYSLVRLEAAVLSQQTEKSTKLLNDKQVEEALNFCYEETLPVMKEYLKTHEEKIAKAEPNKPSIKFNPEVSTAYTIFGYSRINWKVGNYKPLTFHSNPEMMDIFKKHLGFDHNIKSRNFNKMVTDFLTTKGLHKDDPYRSLTHELGESAIPNINKDLSQALVECHKEILPIIEKQIDAVANTLKELEVESRDFSSALFKEGHTSHRMFLHSGLCWERKMPNPARMYGDTEIEEIFKKHLGKYKDLPEFKQITREFLFENGLDQRYRNKNKYYNVAAGEGPGRTTSRNNIITQLFGEVRAAISSNGKKL